MPSFPQPSKSTNPFEVSNERTPAQAPTVRTFIDIVCTTPLHTSPLYTSFLELPYLLIGMMGVCWNILSLIFYYHLALKRLEN